MVRRRMRDQWLAKRDFWRCARHTLLKDVYLFKTHADKVKTAENDLAGLEAQVRHTGPSSLADT
jgi:hypothetical protein